MTALLASEPTPSAGAVTRSGRRRGLGSELLAVATTTPPIPVTAVIVTRGDVDLTQIVGSLAGFDELVIWNNSLENDLGVYGRYAGIRQARHDIVYVQDDDCLIPRPLELAAAYEPGRIVANMPRSRWADYPDSTLVGWGAVFDRDLPYIAFHRFESAHLAGGYAPERVPRDVFLRTCDVVFSSLTPRTVVDVGFQHLPWAEDPARAMFKQAGHKDERDRTLALCRQIRNWGDDDRRVDLAVPGSTRWAHNGQPFPADWENDA